MSSMRFLVSNGVLSHASDTPPVFSFLETHPGAYTTTRTHNNASCVLFWQRHMQRLANSMRILLNSKPQFLFGPSWCKDSSLSQLLESSVWEPTIQSLVEESMGKASASIVGNRETGHEFAITILVGGNMEKLRAVVHLDEEKICKIFDVHIHVGTYIPPAFGIMDSGAHLALLGRGRAIAAGKYSDWVRLRKPLEQFIPPSVTEFLLSDDGDHILEGSKTNFFVVSFRDEECIDANEGAYSSLEVQTAPVGDGVLPGIIRQLVIEICLSKGIPFKEVAPSWTMHHLWEEAFITNSLRLMQHVQSVKVPQKWEPLESKTWDEIAWEEKNFKDGPGIITALIQKEIMERTNSEGYSLAG